MGDGPERAMEPVSVEKTGGAEEVSSLTALLRAFPWAPEVGSYRESFAFEIKRL